MSDRQPQASPQAPRRDAPLPTTSVWRGQTRESEPRTSAPVRYPEPLPTSRSRRLCDILGAIVLLITLFPVFIVVAAAVRLSSPGPIIYRQTRVGLNRRCGADRRDRRDRSIHLDRRWSDRRTIASSGKLFRIMKFRTMIDDAERRLGPTWATANDSRITFTGRILRKTRLDEFPQLLNVLAGDMTFIGPRPERPFFVERFRRVIPGYMERLSVAPGITGLAQVEYHYDYNLDDVGHKLEYDLRYVRNRGLGMDVPIVFKTVRVIVCGSGAR